MGNYVDPDNSSFASDIRSRIYVDKTGLIAFTNRILGTRDGRICVSRPRRFGKSMALNMLSAYYSCGCDSKDLFRGLTIEDSPTFEDHLNRHHVILLDFQRLRLGAIRKNRHQDLVRYIEEQVTAEIRRFYPEETFAEKNSLCDVLLALYESRRLRFIFLIDEWDVVYREDRADTRLKREFTDFLRELFKGADMEKCIELVYMTGILPIQKQDTESALNNFYEYTMLEPYNLAEYVGFTEDEVKELCGKYRMPYRTVKAWYDGYHFTKEHSVYCPASVVKALNNRQIDNYWTQTSSEYVLRDTLKADMPGLRETVGLLLSGQRVELDSNRFQIDMANIETVNDVLVSLVHLGYLSYDRSSRSAAIPNREIASEFYSILETVPEHPAWKIVSRSQKLLEDTLAGKEDAVAAAIQSAHDYYSDTILYNNENALASVVILAYHCALEEDYHFIREFPSGKGFADILLLPRKRNRIPILIELKWFENADAGIRQIKERRYFDRLKGFRQVLLAGISYGNDSKRPGYKEHTCVIELWNMQ